MLSTLLGIVVLFAETDPQRSLGAAVIGAGILGTVAAGRWIMSGRGDAGSSDGVVAASPGAARYAKLVVVMAIGMGVILAGVALRSGWGG